MGCSKLPDTPVEQSTQTPITYKGVKLRAVQGVAEMPIADSPTYISQPPDSPASQVALRILVEGTDIEATPIGTGVWLCDRHVITAKHNIDYIIRTFGSPKRVDGEIVIGDYSIRLYQLYPGPVYVLWNVERFTFAPNSDIALLTLTLHGTGGGDLPPRTFGVKTTVMMPKIGTKVAGFGYHSSKVRTTPVGDGYHLELNDVPQATTGLVTDVYPNGRDRAMYPFPCFQVNARFDPGMSGGPVLSEDGRLLGIIAGSLPGDDEYEAVSYVSSLEPMLIIPVSGKIKGIKTPSDPYPLLVLAQHNLFQVTDMQSYVMKQLLTGPVSRRT